MLLSRLLSARPLYLREQEQVGSHQVRAQLPAKNSMSKLRSREESHYRAVLQCSGWSGAARSSRCYYSIKVSTCASWFGFSHAPTRSPYFPYSLSVALLPLATLHLNRDLPAPHGGAEQVRNRLVVEVGDGHRYPGRAPLGRRRP